MNNAFIFIFTAAIIGFVISLRIFLDANKEKTNHLVCLPYQKCDILFTSQYSRFLGIRTEIWGMFYYSTITLIYGYHLFTGLEFDYLVLVFLLLYTLSATLFSLYLTLVQIFALRKICTLCIFGLIISAIIFVIAWADVSSFLTPILNEYKRLFTGFHILGVVVGLGGTTVADTLLFRFLNDQKITPKESEVLKYISQIIWIGLGITYISGTALFLSDISGYLDSAKFMTKAIVIIIVTINGFALNHIVSPRLNQVFNPEREFKLSTDEVDKYRHITFGLGAISLTSWYSAFVLGLFRSSPASFQTLLIIYFSLLLIALITSQFFAHSFYKKARETVVTKHRHEGALKAVETKKETARKKELAKKKAKLKVRAKKQTDHPKSKPRNKSAKKTYKKQ